MLLFGTCAQESRFLYRRQISFDTKTLRNQIIGGFSLWQLEAGSILAGLGQLHRPNIRERAGWFMRSWPDLLEWSLDAPITDIVRTLQTPAGDPLAVLLARLHYLRVPDPIPPSVSAQAQYWKTHYNTYLGRGTTTQYLQQWHRLCVPVLGATRVDVG